MQDSKQKIAAKAFAEKWKGRGYEKGESQAFWLELLQNVLGVENPYDIIDFEGRVKLLHTSFIDAYIKPTKVLIEQKSIDVDLRSPILQSDGSKITPFQQAKRYAAELGRMWYPRWVVTCNFRSFLIYDMDQPNGEPEELLLENLEREAYRLQFLVDERNEHIRREMQVSLDAGKIVGRIYEALLNQYDDASPEALRWLNILCVRLVFCLYAEDAGIFAHDQFHNYLVKFDAESMRMALIQLFDTLNKPAEKRSKFLRDDLKAFPYTNGGLFAEEIEIPQFTESLRETLLQNAALDFDWSEISPTIFGAVFESTLNPETRRSGGMHYTSIENIHKVIDPLFLNDLRCEYEAILEEKVEKLRARRLDALQDKLASLTFFDPACGSGNFLTETYLSLRRLENDIIRERHHGQMMLGEFSNPIKVSINQFYGIEINDFAVTVATTALWISEAQMLSMTERIIHQDIDFLPLKTYSNIVEGNALRIDWESVVPKEKLDYIIGNPPFVGARLMSESQKQDVLDIFGSKWKNVGNMDYVCCWYKKAAEIMKSAPRARAALVSTNSICQGEQVANLWQPLFADGIHINFAYRTFRWDSEASLKAHVHCVIVGFSYQQIKPCIIIDGERRMKVNNINAYLTDAPDVFVESRQHPLFDVPEIGIGNKPIDGGNYLFEKEEMDEFIKQEPESAKYFRLWYGAVEFLHQKPRYCLWLGDCSPAELRKMPHCLKRVEAVRQTRLESKSEGTRKLADRPTRFHVENMPKGNFIIVPKVSSERRRYVPMGFMTPDMMASDLVFLIPDATLYHFGILESNVHMAWMRAVCGRLEMRYRYSKDVVYNTFPWPNPTPEQKARIEQTAQAILDARALYPDSSLADLYDEVTMPPELRRAHQDNDRAVMAAYGFPVKGFTESDCVARLFEMYQGLTK
ncbi:MAG: class I SAM-dependent DNA methyltransferase [Bacteroidales bacterium]|nr:class I SAM-dependent DNA methyltransferase [Bacteroidales bacterium]